jgi:hypothetical protein
LPCKALGLFCLVALLFLYYPLYYFVSLR